MKERRPDHPPLVRTPPPKESSPEAEYDARYKKGDYRNRLEGYEAARSDALEHFFTRGLGKKAAAAGRILDYGAGNGLFYPLWRRLFPLADIYCCDISKAARDRFIKNHSFPQDHYKMMDGGLIPFPEDSFDLIVSIEVMEHAEHLDRFLKEAWRALKAGGFFTWTTPCANVGSIEHIYGHFVKRVTRTPEGFRRWDWEEFTHIRRLKSREVKFMLTKLGFSDVRFRFRAHFFSFVYTRLQEKGLLNPRTSEKMIGLDYKLFRVLPNGASMIGLATK